MMNGASGSGSVVRLTVGDTVVCGGFSVGGARGARQERDAGYECKASLRNPGMAIFRRSSAVRSFEGASREKAVSTWSTGMPEPLSLTLIDLVPPCSMETEIWVVAAAMSFSTSPLTTEAGRSTTSPAAICAATVGGSTWMFMLSLLSGNRRRGGIYGTVNPRDNGNSRG